jgi:hypothetical protein
MEWKEGLWTACCWLVLHLLSVALVPQPPTVNDVCELNTKAAGKGSSNRKEWGWTVWAMKGGMGKRRQQKGFASFPFHFALLLACAATGAGGGGGNPPICGDLACGKERKRKLLLFG